MNLTKVFEDPKTLASLLLTIYVDRFGREAIEYDPFVIKQTLEKTLEFEIPRYSFNKLLGAISLVLENSFWKDLPTFVILCNALSDGRFDPRIVDLATIYELSIAIADSLIIWPENVAEVFDPSIIEYIKDMLLLEAYIIPPNILRKLLPEVAKIQYDKLIDVQEDPFLYTTTFMISREKALDVDNEIELRTKTSMDYAKELGLNEVATLYNSFLENIKETAAA